MNKFYSYGLILIVLSTLVHSQNNADFLKNNAELAALNKLKNIDCNGKVAVCVGPLTYRICVSDGLGNTLAYGATQKCPENSRCVNDGTTICSLIDKSIIEFTPNIMHALISTNEYSSTTTAPLTSIDNTKKAINITPFTTNDMPQEIRVITYNLQNTDTPTDFHRSLGDSAELLNFPTTSFPVTIEISDDDHTIYDDMLVTTNFPINIPSESNRGFNDLLIYSTNISADLDKKSNNRLANSAMSKDFPVTTETLDESNLIKDDALTIDATINTSFPAFTTKIIERKRYDILTTPSISGTTNFVDDSDITSDDYLTTGISTNFEIINVGSVNTDIITVFSVKKEIPEGNIVTTDDLLNTDTTVNFQKTTNIAKLQEYDTTSDDIIDMTNFPVSINIKDKSNITSDDPLTAHKSSDLHINASISLNPDMSRDFSVTNEIIEEFYISTNSPEYLEHDMTSVDILAHTNFPVSVNIRDDMNITDIPVTNDIPADFRINTSISLNPDMTTDFSLSKEIPEGFKIPKDNLLTTSIVDFEVTTGNHDHLEHDTTSDDMLFTTSFPVSIIIKDKPNIIFDDPLTADVSLDMHINASISLNPNMTTDFSLNNEIPEGFKITTYDPLITTPIDLEVTTVKPYILEHDTTSGDMLVTTSFTVSENINGKANITSDPFTNDNKNASISLNPDMTRDFSLSKEIPEGFKIPKDNLLTTSIVDFEVTTANHDHLEHDTTSDDMFFITSFPLSENINGKPNITSDPLTNDDKNASISLNPHMTTYFSLSNEILEGFKIPIEDVLTTDATVNLMKIDEVTSDRLDLSENNMTSVTMNIWNESNISSRDPLTTDIFTDLDKNASISLNPDMTTDFSVTNEIPEEFYMTTVYLLTTEASVSNIPSIDSLTTDIYPDFDMNASISLNSEMRTNSSITDKIRDESDLITDDVLTTDMTVDLGMNTGNSELIYSNTNFPDIIQLLNTNVFTNVNFNLTKFLSNHTNIPSEVDDSWNSHSSEKFKSTDESNIKLDTTTIKYPKFPMHNLFLFNKSVINKFLKTTTKPTIDHHHKEKDKENWELKELLKKKHKFIKRLIKKLKKNNCDTEDILPDFRNCRKYYRCFRSSHGRRMEHLRCHNGKYFDMKTNMCIDKDKALCFIL